MQRKLLKPPMYRHLWTAALYNSHGELFRGVFYQYAHRNVHSCLLSIVDASG